MPSTSSLRISVKLAARLEPPEPDREPSDDVRDVGLSDVASRDVVVVSCEAYWKVRDPACAVGAAAGGLLGVGGTSKPRAVF